MTLRLVSRKNPATDLRNRSALKNKQTKSQEKKAKKKINVLVHTFTFATEKRAERRLVSQKITKLNYFYCNEQSTKFLLRACNSLTQ